MAVGELDKAIQGVDMDLGLNIVNLKGPGRPAKPLDFEYERDLAEADLELAMTVTRSSAPPPIKKISDRHHALARLLATGMSEGDAALTLNYDPSRVSILKNSPAFQELMSLYRSEVDRTFASNLDHMAGLSKDALLELRERMEEEPEKFSVRELLAITTEMSDRVDLTDTTKLPTRINLVAVPLKNEDSDSGS